MSWQTPEGDPPPESAAQPPDAAAPEPDAETARFPVAETPPSEPAPPSTTSEPEPPPPPEAPPLTPDAPPPAGIISAAPVGWTGPAGETPGNQPADGPVVPWSAPAAAAVATPVGSTAEGVVIARVFPRVVAYFIDGVLLFALARAASIVLGLNNANSDLTLVVILGAVFVVVDLIYFVGLWTSRLQATLGMRLLRLRVLDAATAGTLRLNDALLRWIALAGAIGILGLVPGLEEYVLLIGVIWLVVLLISTATNPLRQGLHDRWARSVVVQPAPGGTGLAVATCLVLVLVFGILLPLAGLAVYGDQLRDILIEIGNSV